MRKTALLAAVAVALGCSPSEERRDAGGADAARDQVRAPDAPPDAPGSADRNPATDGTDTAASPDVTAALETSAAIETSATIDTSVPPDVPIGAEVALAIDLSPAEDVPIAADAPSLLDSTRGEATSREAGGEAGSGEAGRVAGAALIVTPATVNLGVIDLATGGLATVSITNVGSTPSGPLAVSASAALTITGCSGALAAGSTCGLVVAVLPTASGPFSGSISITADPGTTAPLVISVVATVVSNGLFAVQPMAVDLGTVWAGTSAAPFTLRVTALAALADLNVTTAGPELLIDMAATTCTSALASGASCSVALKFVAASAGAKSDSVVISAGGASGKVTSVPVTASVLTGSQLAINPSAPQTFTAALGTTSSPVTFSLANVGDWYSGPLTVRLSGTDLADFAIASDTCSIGPLAPLATCTVSVVFKPGSGGATKTAVLTITETSSGASAAVTLSGTVAS